MNWKQSTLIDLFAPLFFRLGQPTEAPWRLALVTVLQFAEDLSDRQAADAIRSRIDWKYLLGLELEDPRFDFSVFSEFRAQLVAGQMETERDNNLTIQIGQDGRKLLVWAYAPGTPEEVQSSIS